MKEDVIGIIGASVLTDEGLLAASGLVKVVQASGQTHCTPYLSSQLNSDADMAAFFLGYDEGKLVALSAIYVDCQEAEPAILVHPNHRRERYAKALWCKFDEIRRDYRLRPIIMVEKCLLDKNPDLIKHLGMILEPNFEYWLTYKRRPYPLEERTDLTVPEANTAHVGAIVDPQIRAFKEPKERALHYVKEALEDESGKLYTVVRGDTALLSYMIDFSAGYNCFYGSTMVRDCRGQGIDIYFVKRLMDQLIIENEKTLQTAVESADTAAKSPYEKLGFKEQTQVFYAKKLTDFTR